MADIKIDSRIWDLIMEHYAGVNHPSPDDQIVIDYMIDKTRRQINHDSYISQKHIDADFNRGVTRTKGATL